jgi:hypothetical protein
LVVSINPVATVNAGADQTICADGTATLAGTFGGAATSATWTTSGTGTFNNASSPTAVYTPSSADKTAGTVTLTYTTNDPSGPCGSVNDALVLTINPVATVTAGEDQTICAGGTATLAGTFGGAATSATWSTSGDGTFSGNVYTPGAADITAGTVTLTYTTNDPAGPCGSVNDALVLTINPVATVNAGADQTICADGTATLAGSFGGAATSATWTTSGTGTFNNASSPTAVYTPSSADKTAGTVTLTYTTNNPAGPCGSVNDALVLTINPVATVNAGADQTICADRTATLAGTFGGAATSATWSTSGDGTFSENVYTPGANDIIAGTVTLTYTTNDPSGPCGSVNDALVLTITRCINFFGKLKYSRDLSTGVGNGTVTLRNTAANNAVLDTDLTVADGLYSVTATNMASGSFSVKPVKNVMFANGLSSEDAFRINQHVSGANRFTDPFDLVAADVNRNNTVSSQDAALVNSVVLGNPLALLQFNTSWRFIPQSHTLPTNPTGSPLFPVPAGFWSIPDQLSYTNISTDQINQDFVGIKLGDVKSGFANAANRGLKPLIWKVEDQELAVGSDILVSFNAEGFSDLAALQFALGFNTGYLEYKGVQMHARMPLDQSNFGAYNAASGELRTSWYSSTGVALTVRNGVSVFQLQFKVLQAGAKLSDVLYLDTNLLLAEAYSKELVPRGVLLEFTQRTISRDISAETTVAAQDRLLQNQPNPFGNSTQIEFELGEACEAVLSIYDASGRLLWEDRANREAGRHSVTYRSAEGQAPGMLYYTLRTPGATLTQKMVMVRE